MSQSDVTPTVYPSAPPAARAVPPKVFQCSFTEEGGMQATVYTSPLGRFREVLFTDREDYSAVVSTGYMSPAELRDFAGMLRELAAELEREVAVTKETAAA